MQLVTLLCQRDLELGLICLGSLMRYCTDADGLTILDDGTLKERDRERLEEAIPRCRVIPECDRHDLVCEQLASRPHSLRYRAEQPLGQKLFDVPLLLKAGFLFIDADILFFRPFSVANIRAAAQDGFVFMRDERNGYSGSLKDLFWKYGLRLLDRVNAGVIALDAKLLDLDFAEWFLAVPEFRVFPHLLEQTCWAAMPRESPAWFVSKEQLRCATSDPDCNGGVATHFIYPHKGRVQGVAAKVEPGGGLPVALDLEVATRVTMFGILRNRFMRMLN